MRRGSRTLALALLVLAGCARTQPRVPVRVGELELSLVIPKGWEHVNHDRRHEFRLGELAIVLRDGGIVVPDSLAGVPLPPDGRALVRSVFASRLDTLRYEVESLEVRGEGDRRWWVALTWDRGAHGSPARFAVRILRGHLLVLETTALRDEHVDQAFETLLDSIEPAASEGR